MNTTGIILASGASRRLGQPKQLLPWRGDILINYIIDTVSESKVDSLITVLGAEHEAIKSRIKKGTHVVINPDWKIGRSTSIKAGLAAIGEKADHVVFFTVDQPFLEAKLINNLIDEAIASKSPCIVTSVQGVLTVPMLFHKLFFPKLKELTGDAGGKQLLDRNGCDYKIIDWLDEKLLLDVDTKEDYQKALDLDPTLI